MSDKKKTSDYVSGIIGLFREHENKANAVPMKKYMRNQFEFFGINSPERRQLTRFYIKSRTLPESVALRNIIRELWHQPERDLQYFAVELLMKCKKQWTPDDEALFEYLITHKSWWDTVDFLANQVIGPWLKMYPELIGPLTKKWNRSDNIWLQRMSFLFQLKYKKSTDLDLLTTYIRHLSGSKEFFVQKAIGWVLREYSKTDPDWVIDYVSSHKLPSLSKREALKVIERKKSRRREK